MIQNASATGRPSPVAELHEQLLARVASLSYLPTTAAVAAKFVQLGRNPDASAGDYAGVISADASLSTKLFALANSSWFGIRNRVTSIRSAVSLLGLSTVRSLAISYCVTALNSELRLSRTEARQFWQAALCKAVAARQYAQRHDEEVADDAFAAGMLQDLSITMMYATDKDRELAILLDPDSDYRTHLRGERDVFQMDHAEVGRLIARKLELPDFFVDAVTFHHNLENLAEFMESPVVADAVYVSSLLPHVLSGWHPRDAQALDRFLTEHAGPDGMTTEAFLVAVQNEFDLLHQSFEDGQPPEARLLELFARAGEVLYPVTLGNPS